MGLSQSDLSRGFVQPFEVATKVSMKMRSTELVRNRLRRRFPGRTPAVPGRRPACWTAAKPPHRFFRDLQERSGYTFGGGEA
jgi:hypothetical protein